MSSPREMSFELSAAPPPKPAILRELIARDIRECARYGRRIDGEAAKLPLQAEDPLTVLSRNLADYRLWLRWPSAVSQPHRAANLKARRFIEA